MNLVHLILSVMFEKCLQRLLGPLVCLSRSKSFAIRYTMETTQRCVMLQHCRVQVLPSLCPTSTVHGLAYTIDPVTPFSGQDAVATFCFSGNILSTWIGHGLSPQCVPFYAWFILIDFIYHVPSLVQKSSLAFCITMVEGQEARDTWTSTSRQSEPQRGCQREDKVYFPLFAAVVKDIGWQIL